MKENIKQIQRCALITMAIGCLTTSDLIAESINVNCHVDAQVTECQIKLAGRQVLDLFELNNPRRFVVDLDRPARDPGVNYNLARSTDLLSVRSAMHADKYRLVFDVNEQSGNVAWKTDDNFALLRIVAKAQNVPSEQVIVPAEPIVEPTIEPEINQIEQRLPVSQIDDVHSVLHDRQLVVEQPESNPPQQECTHIEFSDQNGSEPAAAVLYFSQYPQYSFSKASARIYRLKVQNAKLASSQLKRPFFPQHSFPAIAYVELQEDENDNLIANIGAEQGANLKATVRNNSVIVQVLD